MAGWIVVGGGVAGLASALALVRGGHQVRLLERDSMPLPADPVEAFERWERRGAPQVWHSHAFLARLRNLLLERAPDVLDALYAHGAYDLRFGDYLPPTIADRTPEPDDEELTLFACRRVTFEWVLRRCVLQSEAARFESDVSVEGLLAEPASGAGPPRIAGVLARRGQGPLETWRADGVIDASGRRSRLPEWLVGIGAEAPREEVEECGIFYCSRFYRLRPGVEPPAHQGVVGADLGYMKFGIFPGDGGIFSITLAAALQDDPLRAILRPGPFEVAAGAFAPAREWLERSEPVSRVRGMAKLVNRRRRFVRDGRPVATGVHAVGDAAVCTNPLYGRGCSLAFVHAYALADAVADAPEDAAAQALAFDAATRRELDPWYRAARDQDRQAVQIAAAQARGEPPDAALSSEPGQVVDPQAFVRSVMREGLLPALRTDVAVVRAFMRVFNLLAPPDAMISDPAVIQRVLVAWREREQRPPAEAQGPERGEMLALLARAA